MDIFNHNTTIKTWIFFLLIALSINFYLIFQEKWINFIIGVPMCFSMSMLTYFGLEWIFEKKEVQ